MTATEIKAFVADSMASMHRAIDDFNRQWDIPSYGQWSLSLDRRVLTFSDGPKPPIDCGILVVGNYMTNRNFWRWSWDNPSIEPPLWVGLKRVRAFGEEHGIAELTDGGWPAQDIEAAWAMTAVTAKLLGAKSVYRIPNEPQQVFLLVTDVR